MDDVDGQTALVLPVPDADPVVGRWRERFDPSAACGMPAHITILFPFLSIERIGSAVLAELRLLFTEAQAVRVRFAALGSFPSVLYLKPEPAAPLLALTESVVGRWPEAPPYEGAFPEVVPHLTVATGLADHAEIRVEVENDLPLDTVLTEASLLAFAAGRWSPVETFPLDNTRTAP